MRFHPTPEQLDWIAEIRAFLAEHVTEGLRAEIDEDGIEAAVEELYRPPTQS